MGEPKQKKLSARSFSSLALGQNDNPENYFSVDVGKKFFGPRFDQNNRLIPYSFIGSKEIFDIPNPDRKVSTNLSISNPASLKLVTGNQSKKEEKPSYYKAYMKMENKDISRLYESYKKRIKDNQNDLNFNEAVPFNVKESLNKQEQLLNYNIQSAKKRDRLSLYISRRIKKDEGNLLINSSPMHRIKSEIRKIIDKKKPSETSQNVHEWMVSLRSSPDDPFKGTYYVNGGTQANPIWSRRKNFIKNNNIEFIRPVNVEKFLPQIETFKKSKFVKECSEKYNINIDNILGYDKIKVEGQNLLEEETKLATKYRGRKIIHQENFGESINETIQQDYLTNKERSLNDLSFVRSQKSSAVRADSGVKENKPLML